MKNSNNNAKKKTKVTPKKSQKENVKISLDKVYPVIDSVCEVLENESLAVQEITLTLYSNKTKKTIKIDAFKEFSKYIDKILRDYKINHANS